MRPATWSTRSAKLLSKTANLNAKDPTFDAGFAVPAHASTPGDDFLGRRRGELGLNGTILRVRRYEALGQLRGYARRTAGQGSFLRRARR